MQTVKSFEGFLEGVENNIAKYLTQGYQIEHMQMDSNNYPNVVALVVFRKEEKECMKIDM